MGLRSSLTSISALLATVHSIHNPSAQGIEPSKGISKPAWLGTSHLAGCTSGCVRLCAQGIVALIQGELWTDGEGVVALLQGRRDGPSPGGGQGNGSLCSGMCGSGLGQHLQGWGLFQQDPPGAVGLSHTKNISAEQGEAERSCLEVPACKPLSTRFRRRKMPR